MTIQGVSRRLDGLLARIPVQVDDSRVPANLGFWVWVWGLGNCMVGSSVVGSYILVQFVALGESGEREMRRERR